MRFKYIVYLQHHSIRPSPSHVFAQWLSARFFIATAYSHRVSSSSQCSRQILSKSPTKQNKKKKLHIRYKVSHYLHGKIPVRSESYIMHQEITLPAHNKNNSPFCSHKHKIPSFGAGRGCEIHEISVHGFCSVCSVKLKPLEVLLSGFCAWTLTQHFRNERFKGFYQHSHPW